MIFFFFFQLYVKEYLTERLRVWQALCQDFVALLSLFSKPGVQEIQPEKHSFKDADGGGQWPI